jgi:Wax ester synthase/diacylglycerol acyltransferase catalytic domain/WS/DGAT C-terminal domain
MSERLDQTGVVVGSADSFFLHMEDSGAPQIAGGIALLHPAPDDRPSLAEVRELVRAELPHLPLFEMRPALGSTWRRPRWIRACEPDLTWHVIERPSSEGLRGLEAMVAELAEEPLPRDRPLWRIVMARDVGPGRSAMIFLMHHALGDGVGTVTNSLQLMRPRTALPAVEGGPGRFARAAGTALGIVQLAADNRPTGWRGEGSDRRGFATARPALDVVRRAADARGMRVTDLLLGLVADAVAATCPELARGLGGELRVAVPRLVARPPEAAEGVSSGNATGAVMVDLPLDGRPIEELLHEVGHRARRLRRPTRAMASRFVMTTGLKVLPEPSVGWFARTVYGRRFFHGIVTNFPGPTRQLSIGGVPIDVVYPILPLAPGAPIAFGALSWHGVLGISVATDPDLVDPHIMLKHLSDTLTALVPPA